VKALLPLLALVSLYVCDAAPDSSADDLLRRALSLASSGRLEEAEKVLLEGKAAFTHDARFSVELAGISWRRKHTRRAKDYLRQGLRLDPSDAYAIEFLGSLYLLDGNVHAALKYWNRIRKPVLGAVLFEPKPPLNSDWVERLPAVSTGQSLTGTRLTQTEQNLRRLRIFSEPRFEITPSPANEYRLIVRAPVMSQPLAGIAGRMLTMLRGLPYQQINFDWLNIDRRAINFTSLWRWDPDKRRIAVNYRVPLPRSVYAIWTDLRDETWELSWSGLGAGNFDVRSAAVGGEIEFELMGGNRWTPGFQLSRHTFRGARSQQSLTNSSVWEVRNRFDFTRRRYVERRVHVDSSVTVRAGRIFSQNSSRLVGAEFNVAAHWLPQQRDDLYTVIGRVRAGAVSGQLPADSFYILAMERDTDLWLRGHVGTRSGRKGSAPMGTRFALAQMEVTRRLLRIPFVRVDVGPFLDTGNVGGEPRFGSRGWLYDTGAQVVLTTQGGFRLSVIYGRDIRDGRNVIYTALSR
jgi:hypothetical protein